MLRNCVHITLPRATAPTDTSIRSQMECVGGNIITSYERALSLSLFPSHPSFKFQNAADVSAHSNFSRKRLTSCRFLESCFSIPQFLLDATDSSKSTNADRCCQTKQLNHPSQSAPPHHRHAKPSRGRTRDKKLKRQIKSKPEPNKEAHSTRTNTEERKGTALPLPAH